MVSEMTSYGFFLLPIKKISRNTKRKKKEIDKKGWEFDSKSSNVSYIYIGL